MLGTLKTPDMTRTRLFVLQQRQTYVELRVSADFEQTNSNYDFRNISRASDLSSRSNLSQCLIWHTHSYQYSPSVWKSDTFCTDSKSSEVRQMSKIIHFLKLFCCFGLPVVLQQFPCHKLSFHPHTLRQIDFKSDRVQCSAQFDVRRTAHAITMLEVVSAAAFHVLQDKEFWRSDSLCLPTFSD